MSSAVTSEKWCEMGRRGGQTGPFELFEIFNERNGVVYWLHNFFKSMF